VIACAMVFRRTGFRKSPKPRCTKTSGRELSAVIGVVFGVFIRLELTLRRKVVAAGAVARQYVCASNVPAENDVKRALS
jgi:hypothetical protein